MPVPAEYENPEPVPSLSQLCALPFVSAVAGYLADSLGCPNTRVTLHRLMTRDKEAYLQQVCSYAGPPLDHSKAGRMFAVTVGIIGKAFSEREVIRTRHHDNEEQWWKNYRADREEVKETGAEAEGVLSYLAVPFLNASGGSAVCVLYAEAGGLNVFTKGEQLQSILGMSSEYCKIIDGLSENPLSGLRNYPLRSGVPVSEIVSAYPRLQEAISSPPPPRFLSLTSFNFGPTT